MTIPFIDSQMLSTLELLHYCRRFEGALFAFCFDRAAHCEALLMDLRVLLASRIQEVIFCPADPSLARHLEIWKRSGERFSVLETTSDQLQAPSFVNRLRVELSAGNAAFVMITDAPTASEARNALHAAMISCVVALGVKKIFFPGEEEGLEINGQFRSYPTMAQLHEALSHDATCNIPRERLLFLVEQQETHNVDIVLVQARRGTIFEEVFTHSGSGTLLTQDYPNILRPANEADVRDIMAIMQPYVTEGSLKAVSEEEILTMIRSFMVYSVNDQIVAAAALIDYGDSCELGKLCTLPRYQARGRARALVRALLDEAKKKGKSSVFALTVSPVVGEFFERLDFKAVAREELPTEWKRGYDFSRPSKAYRYSL